MKNGKWSKALFCAAFLAASAFFVYFLRTTQAGRDVTGVLLEQRSNSSLTRPTDTRLERAFRELKYGMTEAEVRAIVKKHTEEPMKDPPDNSGDWVTSYANGPKIEDGRWYGPNLPKEGVPYRNLAWTGDADADKIPHFNGSDSVRRHTKLWVTFYDGDHLSRATYECDVDLIFPDQDLQLTQDGVYPLNHKFENEK